MSARRQWNQNSNRLNDEALPDRQGLVDRSATPR
jgi:hypothetical protein